MAERWQRWQLWPLLLPLPALLLLHGRQRNGPSSETRLGRAASSEGEMIGPTTFLF